MKKIIKVEGMTCKHCQMRVKNAFAELEGVEEVKVDLDAGTAEVTMSEETGDEAIRDAVDEAGYEVKEIKRI